MDRQATRQKYRDIIDKERPVHVDDHFSSVHPKMDPYERAKIFAPFSALRGLNKTLSSRITVPVPDTDISPEREEEINHILRHLTPGDMVTVTIRKKSAHINDTPSHGSQSRGNIHDNVSADKNTDHRHQSIPAGNSESTILCEKITGTVAKIKLEEGYIRIINERIPLDHIYDIKLSE
ncbi:MAG: hypothetical protein K5750_09220 [Eubacterium sp.]|nr:hypothetical protein [Eubacterium sp.]